LIGKLEEIRALSSGNNDCCFSVLHADQASVHGVGGGHPKQSRCVG